MNTTITIQTTVASTKETVWEAWNTPESIRHWAFASPDWECPHVENDLREGGAFLTRMSARDGSASFDFTGVYTKIIPYEYIAYTINDGRTVEILFKEEDTHIHITETFEREMQNSEDMQSAGWQAILENFKKYVERVTI